MREHKANKEIQLVITKIKNTLLVISKVHKQFSHRTKILKIGLKMIAQVYETTKYFEKETTKKIFEKNFLIDMKNEE